MTPEEVQARSDENFEALHRLCVELNLTIPEKENLGNPDSLTSYLNCQIPLDLSYQELSLAPSTTKIHEILTTKILFGLERMTDSLQQQAVILRARLSLEAAKPSTKGTSNA